MTVQSPASRPTAPPLVLVPSPRLASLTVKAAAAAACITVRRDERPSFECVQGALDAHGPQDLGIHAVVVVVGALPI
jgi:hypothetical protein